MVWKAACILLALTAWQLPASADEGALAEQLFRDGQSLMKAKQYDEACPKLAESQRLDPSTGTLLNLAVCHQQEGKLASAWNEFNEVIALARKDGRDDRVDYAQKRLAEVEPLLSKLIIDVSDGVRVKGLTVMFDGTEVRQAAWGVALPVDPGAHQITVTAPGKKEWSAAVKVTGEAQGLKVAVPQLENGPPEDKATKAEQGEREPVAPAQSGKTQRMVGLGVGIFGVVAVGLGSAFGVDAMKKKQTANEEGCDDNVCPNDAGDVRDQAKASGTISTVAFAVGAAALGTGLVLYFTAPGSTNEKNASIAWRAQVTPLAHGAHMGWGARW
jgi:hypothetical protein